MDIKNKMQKGFTLVEFVIVILLVTILSVMVVFSWQGSTITTEGQAQQVANDIRYAQSLAMTGGQRYRWVRVSATTYQVQNNSGTPVMLALGSTTGTLSSGATFAAFTNLPSNLIAFDGQGTPYTDTGSPGTALSSSASIPVTAGEQTSTVVISPQTGRVIVQ